MKHRFWENGNKKKVYIMVGTVIVLCLGILIAVQVTRNHSLARQSSTNKIQTSVDVLTVARTELIKRIALTGQTVPKAQVDIAAKYQGKITAVYSDLGQQVAAGQILIVQDTGDADISIKQNQAAYQQAAADAVTNEVSFHASYDKVKADYQRSLVDYQRYQTLYAQGAISREDLDNNKQTMINAKSALDTLVNQMNASSVPSTIESARAAALKAQHNISAVEKQREDLVLRAPRDGVVGYRQVEVGSMVSAGQKLLSIVDNSEIYVDCQVSEQDLAALSTNMNVDVQIESLGKSFPGKIIFISPATDSQSQSFSLRIALINPDSSVKSGMFAKTIIQAVLRPNVLMIPQDAFLNKNGKSYVYVVDAQNVVEERNVQVGAKGDKDVEILSGLNEGEQIAINNLARLRSGMVVISNSVTRDSDGDSQ
ncbi:MAG TPA: efflux RND transporter periplasmic adaptor subunit [Negativicutes bacterium]